MKKITFFILLAITSLNTFAQTVPAYIPTSGLLCWYPFSGNANNAYATGKNGIVLGPTLTTDRFGNPNSAYHFNGMLDHILIDTPFFDNGWSDYTISLWMNSDTIDNHNNVNNDQTFINTIPHNGLGINMNWGHCNKYGFYVNSDPSLITWNTLFGARSNADNSVHIWNHMVFEKKHDTAYSFYLNGVLDSTFISHVAIISYLCRMNIGNIDSTQGNEGVWGKVDDYGIWNRTLSSCEIKRLFISNPYLYLTGQPVNDTAHVLDTSRFTITSIGTGNTYQWQENAGTGFTNLTNTSPYSGVTTPTLTITPATATLTGRQYRCIVNGNGGCTDTSANGKLTISALGINNINATPSVSIVPNPTTGLLSVIDIDKVNIQVYNSIGQLLVELKSSNKISITGLPAGIYMVKLFDTQGLLLHTQRIIKQ